MKQQLHQGILFTDHYQLTMAQLYFRQGIHERPALFDHYFRNYPDYGNHQAGFCVAAGMGWLLDWMREARFAEPELSVLRGMKNDDGSRCFDDDFLDYLAEYGNFEQISIKAIEEGRVVHPNTPMTVVQGPLAMSQILETALLAMLNYQTLIATRAARIRFSGREQLMLDFGMRRGHDFGANAGSRAALIGGADFSSNVGISHLMGVPSRGTHAHSLVQAFLALGMTELDAFRAYAESYPDQCLLLVDTINTLESGVPNAIRVFEEVRRRGYEPIGVRLDSGDLAYLSIQVSKQLDAAGFDRAKIALSNNLDEMNIWQIVTQIQLEAHRYGVDAERLMRRLVFGVGTRLMTSEGDSALGGVYKLVALEDKGAWQPAIKLSESSAKTPNPSEKQLFRLYDQRGIATADYVTLADESVSIDQPLTLRHPTEPHRHRVVLPAQIRQSEPLLKPTLDYGLRYQADTLTQMRQRRDADIDRLDPGVRRLVNPHIYHVSLSQRLWEMCIRDR